MRDKRGLVKELCRVRSYKVGHTWPRAEIRSNDKDEDQRNLGLWPLIFPEIPEGPGALFTPCIPDIVIAPKLLNMLHKRKSSSAEKLLILI